jgi:hypothetical protein
MADMSFSRVSWRGNESPIPVFSNQQKNESHMAFRFPRAVHPSNGDPERNRR